MANKVFEDLEALGALDPTLSTEKVVKTALETASSGDPALFDRALTLLEKSIRAQTELLQVLAEMRNPPTDSTISKHSEEKDGKLSNDAEDAGQ